MIDKTISHYKIIEKLGEGAMGIVYKAEDIKLERFVALKFLPMHLTANENEKKRFLQEAKAAAQLNHPNICTVYEVDEVDGQSFIAMELVEGTTLREIIAGNLPQVLNLWEVIHYAIQIAEALQTAHGKGIVHRDIKSENIMVNDTGQIKIMDFGLAKIKGAARLTKTSSIAGTVAYMSPEQIQAQEVDARTDIWSYGVVLYEMLTGRLPFKGEYESAMMYSIVHEDPEPVQEYRSELSSEFLGLLNRILEKERKSRYQSIGDILDDLNKFKIDLQNDSTKPEAGKYEISKRREFQTPKINQKKYKRLFLPTIILLCMILVASIIYLMKPFSFLPKLPLKTAPFTSMPGAEREPEFSPDGSKIAFSWFDESLHNKDIYVKEVGSNLKTRLTTHPGSDYSPTWSPDGQHIAFCRNHDGKSGIYVISSEGGSEQPVHVGNWLGKDPLGNLQGIYDISWSPDSQYIAISGKFSFGEPSSIYLYSINNSELRKLTSPPLGFRGDLLCSFSPDGEKIAFYREVVYLSGDLYLMSILNRKEEQLTFNKSWIGGFTWASNEEIIYSSLLEGSTTMALWRISTKGGKSDQLLVSSDFIEGLTIFPSDNRLAYVDWKYNSNIYRLEVDGSNQQTNLSSPFISSSRMDCHPQYSPDGSKIAFASLRSGSAEMFICDSSGANQVQITSLNNGASGTPRWSPDGSKIIFDSRPKGQCDIFMVKSKGGEHQKLTESDYEDQIPCWSMDGKWIIFSSNRSGEWQIWKKPLDGGRALQLTLNGGASPRTLLTDNWVYYNKEATKGGVFRIPFEGGKEELVLDTLVSNWTWCPTKDGIYFIDRSKETTTIEFFNFKSKNITTVTEVDIKGEGYPAISPDGKWLVFANDEGESDIVMVENF